MNKKFKEEIKLIFEAPNPTKKDDFLNDFLYPKANFLDFFYCQIGYIRKGFWVISILLVTIMIIFAKLLNNNLKSIGLISSFLPLLTLIAVTEINKSISYNMEELELSCKYNLSKVTLIRLIIVGSFHFIMLPAALILFTDFTEYGVLRYTMYTTTPFLLSSLFSLLIMNHLRTKETIYICSGVTIFISIFILFITTNYTIIYLDSLSKFWCITFILILFLICIEVKNYMKNTEELKWNSKLIV